ncbi:hypothetical protein S7711_04252 [Stachybotrys chartarum IBT 7711]|uniref:Uncharacterized protein n=1 Tax=Stachybotrys chartarum (strain CBS 109288 / IBT 7711) TaxID=1280523 RepID=A0A084AIN3_STACB|nr:hypothetical protein S7711_04252 [Stachybotrys chartarum IBT 7711]
MEWSRYRLSRIKVFYDDEVRGVPCAPYPEHVEKLRASILDFSCSIVSVDNHLGKSSLDSAAGSWQKDHVDPAVKQAYGAHQKAMHLHQGGYQENEWVQLFRSWFFEPLESSSSASSGGPRSASRNNYYYDGFKTKWDGPWTLFDGRDDNDNSPLPEYERNKCPRPDFACFLPMYHLDAEPRIPRAGSSEGRNWHQSPNHPIVEQLSWSVLKSLWPYQLRPTPFKIFHKPPMEADLKCYPWLVVEHKKGGSDSLSRATVETVSCQAANAAACAVKLNENAARYAIESDDSIHIPPIPTITTIGSKVKVWIMYKARNFYVPDPTEYYEPRIKYKTFKSGFLMRAVWQGDMMNLQDTAKFQIILENVHTWAMRVFRPQISSYIDMWRVVHTNVGIGASSAALLHRQQIIERSQTIIPMIQDFLVNTSSYHAFDGRFTPLMMGMMFSLISTAQSQTITNEVDRILTEKIKALSLPSETSFGEARQPTQTRTTSAVRNRSSLLTLSPTVDNDDPTDGDCEDSQPSSVGPGISTSDALSNNENDFKHSTRSNPMMASPASSLSKTPCIPIPTVEDSPDFPVPSHREPVPPAESATSKDAVSARGPTPSEDGQVSVDSGGATPRGATASSPDGSETTKPSTPEQDPKPFRFILNDEIMAKSNTTATLPVFVAPKFDWRQTAPSISFEHTPSRSPSPFSYKESDANKGGR